MNNKVKAKPILCPQCQLEVEDVRAVRCPRCNAILFNTTCQGNCSKCQTKANCH